MSLRSRAELALVLAAILWGSTFVIIKDALADITPVLYLLIRFSLSSLLLLAFVRSRPSRRMVLGGILTGAFVGVGMILQTYGLRDTSASNVGFLTSLYIPLVPFVAALVYQARTGWREGIAVVLATLGLALLSFDPSTLRMNRGDILTVAAALMFSFQIVFVKRFAAEGDAVWMAWFQVFMTAAVSALAIGFEHTTVRWTTRLQVAMAITVLGATVIAYLLQAFGQKYTSANRAALIFALEPVFACAASYLWLNERLPPRGWFGAALVLLAVLLAELKPGAPAKHSSN